MIVALLLLAGFGVARAKARDRLLMMMREREKAENVICIVCQCSYCCFWYSEESRRYFR